MKKQLTLREIFDKYDCDKGSKHGYERIYEPIFEEVRNDPINLLEVGIYKGNSIEAWLEYFPNATITGIDIFDRVDPMDVEILNHPRVNWVKADSTVHIKELNYYGHIEYDFIIDDGLHTPEANMKTFQNLSPLLNERGRYFIEDVFPFDVMTEAQKEHPWIKTHQKDLNYHKFIKLLTAIGRSNLSDAMMVYRHDLRSYQGTPDSYIIQVAKVS